MSGDAPWVLDHAPWFPFLEPRTARPPGLMPLPEGGLVTVDADFAAQMAERERLLAACPAMVIACLPEGRAAAAEMLETVIAGAPPAFGRDGDGWLRPDGVRVSVDRADPLASLGRMVAEDWCLLLPDPAAGEYRLSAAVLCFPSRWTLVEKMGRPLTAVHAPVPGYAETLAARVNRVFEAIRPGRGLWRANWLIHGTPELYLPLREGQKGGHPGPAPRRLYLRTERQVLVRLPGTGAVAFGIKTSVCPLAALAPAQAAVLAAELGGIDAAEVAYRAGGDLHRAALAALGEIAGQGAAAAASSAELNARSHAAGGTP